MNDLDYITKMLIRTNINFKDTYHLEQSEKIISKISHEAFYENGQPYGTIVIPEYEKIKTTTISVESGYCGFVTEMVFDTESGKLLRMGAFE